MGLVDQLRLSLLPMAIFLVALYVARRRDRRDAPLALLLGWVALADLLMVLLNHLALQFPSGSGARRVVCMVADPVFCSEFGVHWVVARRYRRGEWVWQGWTLAAFLWLGAANGVVYLTGVPVRFMVLHLTCLLAIFAASYEQVRLLQSGEVAPAHAVLGLSTAVCLLQLVVAFTPTHWTEELYRPAVLIMQVVILLVFLVRLLLPVREAPPATRHRA